MYYYVFEQIRDRASERFRERLADLATDYGIAGEMVTQSALKTLDELLELGIQKGYTTIVAVGSDLHINRVISSLMARRPSERPVLGMVPTERDSLVALMIDVADTKSALLTLKQRHLAYAPLVYVEPGRYLFTEATLNLSRPGKIQVAVDTFRLEGVATELILSGDCRLLIHDRSAEPSPLARSLAWLVGMSLKSDQGTSLIRGESIRIDTPTPQPFLVSGEIFARTPLSAQLVRRALKLIVRRATVSQESKPAP